MTGSNEWDSRPAPRFHLMITGEGPLRRYRFDVPQSLVERLERRCAGEPLDQLFEAAPTGVADYLEILGAGGASTWSGGPVYMAAGPVPSLGEAVAIGPDNAALLAGRLDDWLADVGRRAPFMAVVEGGKAASICASVRISDAAHEAGVETHRDHRRRGLAARAVAAWANAVRSLGATPFYSTSWENEASQGVARRVGFALIGADFHVA